jgi:hypothetical protein
VEPKAGAVRIERREPHAETRPRSA